MTGLKLQVSRDAQVLDVLLNPEDRLTVEEKCSTYTNLIKTSAMEKAKDFLKVNDITENNMEEMCLKFNKSFTYSSEDVSSILEATEGQSSNKLWFIIRQGMLTASNFEKACHYIDKESEPSKSFICSIFGENQLDENRLPLPLKWGRRKEPLARLMYQRLFRRYHFAMKAREKGLLVSEQYPFLGCSVDGLVTCRCRPPHPDKLIEIKCPYASRDKSPKDAAIEKKVIFNEDSHKWEVSSECPYYTQIQGQLGLYGLSECDLVIYTRHGIHISTVVFDSVFFTAMLKKLLLFHQKYIIPIILHKALLD